MGAANRVPFVASEPVDAIEPPTHVIERLYEGRAAKRERGGSHVSGRGVGLEQRRQAHTLTPQYPFPRNDRDMATSHKYREHEG